MPEGVLSSGGQLAEPTFDDPKVKPPDDPKAAPFGWTWSRGDRRWRAKKAAGRGGNKPTPVDAEPASESSGSDRDPDPGWFADEPKPAASNSGGKRRLSIDDVPQAVRDDIAGFAGLVGAPILAMLQQADPYCGSALAQSFEPIVDACLPLICRSEKIVRYFTGDQSDWLLWGKLALALRPVATAVLQHHVFRSVQVVRDERGVAHVVPVDRSQGGHGDHLTPPQPPAFQYAA